MIKGSRILFERKHCKDLTKRALYSILNEIVMDIHIVLKTRLWSVSKNTSMAENIKNVAKVVFSISLGFLEETKKEVIGQSCH